MESNPPETRSLPRRKYTVDAFEGIEELQPSGSSKDDQEEQIIYDEETDDDVFEVGPDSPEPEEDDPSSDADEALQKLLDQANDTSSDDALGYDASLVEETDGPEEETRLAAKRKFRRKRPIFTAEQEKLCFRGCIEQSLYRGAEPTTRFNQLYGPSKDGYATTRKAFRRWGQEPCLPTRTSHNGEQGGMRYSDAFLEEIQRAESNWKWYDQDGGKERLRQNQTLRALTPEQGQEYVLASGIEPRRFIMGPSVQPSLINLEVGQAVLLIDAFRSNAPKRQPPKYKNGFIINLGATVQCLEWAPSQAGAHQYLAASMIPQLQQPRGTSMFDPQPATKSTIQIWHFMAGPENYIDIAVTPAPVTVLCTSIGDIRALKWCQVPSKIVDRLGLLGCISGDGALRIFDVPDPHMQSGYLDTQQAAFTSKPPNTVCTSLTWLSATRIAAGCANGYVAIWDLSHPSSSTTTNPRPALYIPLAMTYIFSITSAYPTFPQLLLHTNMGGFLAVTDLTATDPASPTSTATSQARQVGTPLLAWHDASQTSLSVEDNLTVKAFPLRRMFGSVKVGRFQATCTAVATSLCHPFTLWGLTDGGVAGFNPLRRVMKIDRGAAWYQTWFAHEWRPATAAELGTAEKDGGAREDGPSSSSAENGADPFSATNAAAQDRAPIGAPNGLSRISEGFKAQPFMLISDRTAGKAANVQEGVVFTAVYEAPSAVSAVAWNPNLHVGGWAAAGMGSGLIRVEDLAA